MPLEPEQQDRYIAIWAKAVDTQMHFNEMSVKSRQLGLTFVAAALGVAVVLLSQGEAFSFTVLIGGTRVQFHVAVFLTLGALLAINAVKLLDLKVYHRMLRGAVTFGEDFEEVYMKQIFNLNLGMTQAISHYSRHDDANRKRGPEGKYEYTGSSPITAEHKIRRFYNMTSLFLVFGAVILFGVTNFIETPATDARAPSPAALESSAILPGTEPASNAAPSAPSDKPTETVPSAPAGQGTDG